MDYVVSDSNLTSVANAIRTKAGTSAEIYFPDGFVSAIGAIPNYTLISRTEIEASTTSTSSSQAALVNLDNAWTKDKIVYVRIRDKAGKRPGYFYGSDNFLINVNAANSSGDNFSTALRAVYRYTSGNEWGMNLYSTSAGYGVYAYSLYNTGALYIFKRYSADASLTVDGTYICEVYLLDWVGGSPFNA